MDIWRQQRAIEKAMEDEQLAARLQAERELAEENRAWEAKENAKRNALELQLEEMRQQRNQAAFDPTISLLN